MEGICLVEDDAAGADVDVDGNGDDVCAGLDAFAAADASAASSTAFLVASSARCRPSSPSKTASLNRGSTIVATRSSSSSKTSANLSSMSSMARHRRQKSPTFNQSMKLQINE